MINIKTNKKVINKYKKLKLFTFLNITLKTSNFINLK